MRSEIKKTFQHGFDLTEQELRRIVSSLSEQMKRLSQDAPSSISFEVKLQNGVIANTSNLEEVFALDNIGSEAITRLLIRLEESTEEPSSSINLEFVDANTEPGSERDAISYTIVGDDRDWVFVTSSQLDERIARIKRFAALSRFARKGNLPRVFGAIMMSIFVIVGLVASYYWLFFLSVLAKQRDMQIVKIDSLEAGWKSGEFTDPIEVILELERIRLLDPEELERLYSPPEVVKTIAVPISILALLVLAMSVWVIFFPAYNFVWGDYTRIYEKRKNTGTYILGGIFLTLLLNIFANYIAVLLGIR